MGYHLGFELLLLMSYNFLLFQLLVIVTITSSILKSNLHRIHTKMTQLMIVILFNVCILQRSLISDSIYSFHAHIRQSAKDFILVVLEV